ncbi:MAG TPA: zf-HC2 domain-containing protein [Verrucomicrobiae bacterium]|jgi:anti-sigma factor RsiW
MNCERFQKNLFEYLDESLPPSNMTAARAHLAGCSICRKRLQRELALAQSLSGRMEQAMERVTLEPHVQRDMVAAIERKIAEPARSSLFLLWRLTRPLAAAAAVLLATFWTGRAFMTGGESTPRAMTDAGAQQISVHVSYSTPAYEFKESDDTVIDAIASTPRVADGILLVKKRPITSKHI